MKSIVSLILLVFTIFFSNIVSAKNFICETDIDCMQFYPKKNKSGELKVPLIKDKTGKLVTGTIQQYKDNVLVVEIPCKNGKKNGAHRIYSEEGKIKLEIFYEDGIETGVAKEYYRNGFLKSVSNSKTQETKMYAYYTKKGKVVKTEILKATAPKNFEDYIYESYDENGVLTKRRQADKFDFVYEPGPVGIGGYKEDKDELQRVF